MKDLIGGIFMFNNLIYMMQNTTVEQIKNEMDKNSFVDKNLKDFNKGKEIIDDLFKLNNDNLDDSVKCAILLYFTYKAKGGM